MNSKKPSRMTLNNESWKVIKRCPLCTSENKLNLIYIAADYHYRIHGLFPIVRCEVCTLVFLNPVPSEEELTRLYPPSYYSYQSFKKKNKFKAFIRGLLFFNIETKDPFFSLPGRMLDIGCGSGSFLHAMREKGWETYGVEVNTAAAELGRKSAGLEIISGNLLDAAFPENHFDYIRLNHSFEHLLNPNEILMEIYRILRPDGKVLIGVPNIDGLNARIFKKYWWYLGAPVHPFNYSVRTLSYIVEKHHFVIDSVKFNSDYSGVLGSLQIFLNRNTDKISTEGRLFNNPALVLFSHWISKLVDGLKLGDAIEIICTKK